ncbi:MAG TPA: hypothetical protein VF762_21155 [Blastocatellia bacterium]|jgi:hypothetical protein
MKQSQIRALVRKLVVLSVLVVCLGIFSFGFAEKNASAAACCDSCDPSFDSCITSCGDPAPSACIFFCNRQYNRCLSTCDPGC